MSRSDEFDDYFTPISLHRSSFEQLLKTTLSDREFHELKRFLSDTYVNDDIAKFAIERIHDELPLLEDWKKKMGVGNHV